MSFAHPLALLLLLLLIPVGLLYWLRLRVPRVVIGTGVFWQQALAEEPFRAPLAAVADACLASTACADDNYARSGRGWTGDSATAADRVDTRQLGHHAGD